MYSKVLKSYDDLLEVATWLKNNAIHFNAANPKQITVEKFKHTRSQAQNRALWGWYYKNLSEALDDAGISVEDDDGRCYPYTAELLHEIFKDAFLVKTEITRKGVTRKLHHSTADLPKSGDGGSMPSFSQYLDKIKNFSREYWHIDIPDPVSGYYRDLMERLK